MVKTLANEWGALFWTVGLLSALNLLKLAALWGVFFHLFVRQVAYGVDWPS